MTFQELLAAQVASGGQNVITPDNAGRILGLAAQQEANRQLSLAAGNQAVQEAINRQIASGERAAPDKEGKMDQYGQYVSPLQRSGQVVTAPSGVKFVTDAQGNVIGTNAPIGIGDSVDKRFINQGQATAQERALLGPEIRESFMLEMQKQAPKQPSKVEEKVTAQEPVKQPAKATTGDPNLTALMSLLSNVAQNASATSAPKTGVTEEPIKGLASLRQSEEEKKVKEKREGRLMEAAKRAEEFRKKLRAGQGTMSREELQSLAEEYAAAKAEDVIANPDIPENKELLRYIQEAQKPLLLSIGTGVAPKGILPELGFSFRTAGLNFSDFLRNELVGPASEALTGETFTPSNELLKYFLQQRILRQENF